MDTKKETVICVNADVSNYLLALIEKINKKRGAPFYYKMYNNPITNEEEISKCVTYVKEEGKDCVLGMNEPSSYICAVINERLGYPSPSPLSNVMCRNKYQSRMLVSDFEWCYGFNLGDPVDLVVRNVKTFPCMLKPTMLFRGKGVFRCNNEASLRSRLQDIRANKDTYEHVQAVQKEVLHLSGENNSSQIVLYDYMVEKCIETNDAGIYEYYMEVVVTKEGNVIPYCLSEMIHFQDKMVLAYVIPPIHFDSSAKPFEDYAIGIGNKLYGIGFKNQVFNIQFWRFPDGNFCLVEINPRIAATALDLFKKYSGNNIFDDVTNLFLHNKVPAYTPMSVLKDRLAANTHEEQYTLYIEFSTRSVGLVSSVFNYDLLEDLTTKGYDVIVFEDKSCLLTESSLTIGGKLIAVVTIKGTWNEIVKEEKSLREKLYMGLPQYSECFEYPKYFTEK